MKKTVFFIVILAFSLSSCIEIIEEIHINPDKSGNVIWKIDLGVISEMSKMFMGADEAQMLADIEKFPKKGIKSISEIPGISNAMVLPRNKENGSYGLQFDFQNTKSLNQAYYSLIKTQKKWYYPSLVKVKKRKFKRRDFSPFIDRFDIELPKTSDAKVLSLIKVKSIVHLPRETKKVKNKGTYSPEQLTVVQEFSLDQFLTGSVNTGNKIRF